MREQETAVDGKEGSEAEKEDKRSGNVAEKRKHREVKINE